MFDLILASQTSDQEMEVPQGSTCMISNLGRIKLLSAAVMNHCT